jgi:hypothetical protein
MVSELAEYHFTLHHNPRKLNRKADLLSQKLDHEGERQLKV